MSPHPALVSVTARIAERSRAERTAYLDRTAAAAAAEPARRRLGCANLAHGVAACADGDKAGIARGEAPNIAIVTAYNDMLSAHQPYGAYPDLIKAAARAAGATAQVAGGVPAMCDGVTQGEPGMELSLFSRDVIALSTAIALSHRLFDAVLCLGVCDKIVPGLVIGALSFGHLPAIFVPAGPMPSGLSNDDKARVREAFAEGRADRAALLAAESAAYHAPGTCTFYGTANSNQMLMEFMGLQAPGSSFVNPGTPLRDALTRAAVARAATASRFGAAPTPLAQVLDERAFVNAIVGLLATGGSTNHTIHLIAMAAAAGIRLTWDDFAELSAAVPLLARVYPNGRADVNGLEAAGGLGFVIGTLLDAGLLHTDVQTAFGPGLARYAMRPHLADGDELVWQPAGWTPADSTVLRPATDPFQPTGGLTVLAGNLGRAIIKTSAMPADRGRMAAPARVFDDQAAVQRAFQAGELDRDVVVVVRFQGPKANGMPELHKLMPPLTVLQNRGHRVALVTDGRLSGASGKVPAALHVTPEARDGGPIARLRDGDPIIIDAAAGVLEVALDTAVLAGRAAAACPPAAAGVGRELFARFRELAGSAELGGGAVS